jgi:hypothetical protein
VCLIVRTIDVFSVAHPHARADTVVTRSMEPMDRLAVLPTGLATAIDSLGPFSKTQRGLMRGVGPHGVSCEVVLCCDESWRPRLADSAATGRPVLDPASVTPLEG